MLVSWRVDENPLQVWERKGARLRLRVIRHWGPEREPKASRSTRAKEEEGMG